MDYLIIAQTLVPVIVVTIAAQFIISSQDKQIATLLSLVDYQEKDIASLKNAIDVYEDILVDINSMNHPKHPDDDSCKSYAQLTAEMDEIFIQSVW